MVSTPSRFKLSSRMRAPESFTANPPVRPSGTALVSAAFACGIVPEESSIPHRFGLRPRPSACPGSPAPLPRLRRALLDAGLRGGQPRDGHHVRGAGHIVHAHAVAELHRRRLAAVLAADAHLEL